MEKLFIVSLFLTFIGFLTRTAIYYMGFKNEVVLKNNVIKFILDIAMTLIWVAWLSMNIYDPYKVDFPDIVRNIAVGVSIIGFGFFVLANYSLAMDAKSTDLTKTGIYSRIRHPMYVGFILILLAAPVYMQSFLTFASGFIWILHVICWAKLEEEELEENFKGYKDYKKQTWF